MKLKRSIGYGEITVRARVTQGQAFLNSLMYNHKVRVRGVELHEEGLYFSCKPTEYKKVALAAREFSGNTKVIERKGLYFPMRKNAKRYGLVAGALGYLAVIVILSMFIWEIKIEGNSAVTNAQILEQLELEGIHIGMRNRGINKAHAEISLLLSLDKLAWASVEKSGSRITVKVSEREDVELPLSKDLPCNIVAGKAGRIVETEVYKGTMLLTQGSGVAQGDIIVSGIVNDGADNLIPTHADAKIIAECEEEVSFFSPYTTFEKKKTGKTTQKDYLIFLGVRFPLQLGGGIPDKYNYKEEIRQPTLFGMALPYRIKSDSYIEYEAVEVTYSAAQTLDRLSAQVSRYKDNFYDDVEIVSWSEELLPTDEGIGVRVYVRYREDIARKAEIYLH